MPDEKKVEHHKRAGIFYGSPEGHPIIWNNDWSSLIQKEILSRDTFSRKYLAGEVKIIPATFANPVKGESREWRSTYKDLGEWGQTTFRKNVPHKVSKTDVELPSIPPTAAGSRAMSEYAHRHANFQLGKTLQAPYQSKSKSTKPPKIQAAIDKAEVAAAAAGDAAGGKDEISKEEKTALKQFLAATLLATVHSTQAKAEVRKALSRSLQKERDEDEALAATQSSHPNPFEGGGRQRRHKTAGAGGELGEAAKWRSVYEDLGNWGPKTQQRTRPKIVSKLDVEGFGGTKDINKPVYPGSPKPHTGAKEWKTDYSGLGHWGPDTFRKWIPAKVSKASAESDPNVSDVKLALKTPKYVLKDAIKTSSMEGPRPMWEPMV